MPQMSVNSLSQAGAYVVCLDMEHSTPEHPVYRGYRIMPNGYLYAVTPQFSLISYASDSLHAYLERKGI